MSKIRTNNLQARSNDGTITIGNRNEDGSVNYKHTTQIIGGVDIEGYASKEYVLNKLTPGESPIEDFVLTEDAGKPSGYARLDADAQVQWTDMKDTIRDNHFDYRTDKPHSEIDIELTSAREGIIELQGEIKSIVDTNEKGVWANTDSPEVESGQFYVDNQNLTQTVNVIRIAPIDADGATHTFESVEVGSWIEMVVKGGDTGLVVDGGENYLLGEVTDINDEGEEFVFTIKLSSGKGIAVIGEFWSFRAFEVIEQFDPTALQGEIEKAQSDIIAINEDSLPLLSNRIAAGETTQEAIQATVDQALMTQAIISARPPGVHFMYQSGSSGLNDGHFQYYSSNTRMRISAKGADIDWLSDGPRTDYHMESGPYFTIYHMPNLVTPNDRPQWRVRKTGRISRIDWHENDILCYISSQESSSTNFGDGASYYITIGGIF